MFNYKINRKANKKSYIASSNEDETSMVLSSNDYIFSQASIVASVALEESSFLINPLTSKFVNVNGDTWSNESLKSNYKSFIGAFNYINHVQIPSKSVGFIPDAALRRIIVDKDKNVFIYYVDILVATHRDFESLVNKILSNKVKFLSMGCDAKVSQCSKCGDTFDNEFDFCDCLTQDKGKYYFDQNGNRRVIAELLGTEEEDTVNFIEASWLTEVPAFSGAVKRSTLPIPEGTDIELSLPNNVLDREAIKMYLK